MKKILPLFLLAFLFQDATFQISFSEKEIFKDFVENHRFSVREKLTPAQIKEIPKRDRPDLAWEQNFLATMNPALGRPTPEKLPPVLAQVQQIKNQVAPIAPGAAGSPWTERGPDNVGGRTRALMYDPNDPTGKKVWAGAVAGGLWYNDDITSSTSQWQSVDDFWDNIAVSSIAHDPTNTQIFYVGTGESWGQSFSGTRGAGVWKTTDGGTTWTLLSATTGFYYVTDVAVNQENGNGVLYVGVTGFFNNGQTHGFADEGLQRSTNGGTSFTQVMPNVPGNSFNFAVADIEISKDSTVWVGTTQSAAGFSDRGGGRILKSSNGTSWSIEYTGTSAERVELACAPSDEDYVYAMMEVSSQVGVFVKTTNGGTTWSNMTEPNDADPGIPSGDFSRGQAWYDMILAVDPNNRNRVITGAVDLFKTTNGGSSWSQISHWYGGFTYPYVHADQHSMAFKPGSSTEVIFGHDGGVTRSTNITSSSPSFSSLNNGYNVTQFYACAIHPTAGTDYFLGGTQDNGSQQFSTAGMNSTVEATGGDGAFCFIDQTNSSYQITSYVYNSFWRSTNGGFSFQNPRMQSDFNTGRFINPADYDDQQDVLFSARTSSTINRITNVGGSPSVSSFSVSGMSSLASALRVSPYTTTSTTLFVGTGGGDLYKITNADGSSPSSSSIGGSLPSGYISCIEIGANENQILVTYSNYGLTSVWYTSNGGLTWSNKEGSLPDMPVRWALFNPNDRNEVILATEVGVWSTTNFNNVNPAWTPSNSGLSNVRVDMLQIRDSDGEIIAATHGRGLFSGSFAQVVATPVADFRLTLGFPCLNETVQFTDSSTGVPTSWQWNFSPNTVNFVNGTSATSQNPAVQFTDTGWYDVTLIVSNAMGSDSLAVSQLVRAGGAAMPYLETFEANSTTFHGLRVSNPDQNITWAITLVGGTSPGNRAAYVDNFDYNAAGQVDGLLTPAIDLSGYNAATLSFDYAYRNFSATFKDSLAVYASTNCGATWTRIAFYEETGSQNFATGMPLGTEFTPSTSSDWCGATGNPACPSLNLSAFVGQPSVKFRFDNLCGYGNNIYIDNINVTGTQGALPPTADFSANQTSICASDTVAFFDNSSQNPTAWSWTFTPGTVTFVNGTSATSQDPEVRFNAGGNYTVALTSTNAAGNDTETKTGYISVGSSSTPTVSISANQISQCVGSQFTFTSNVTNGGSNPTYQWKLNGNNVWGNLPTYFGSNFSNNDQISLEITSNSNCVTQTVAASNVVTISVTPPPAVSIGFAQGAPSGPLCKNDPAVSLTGTPSGGTFSGPGVSGSQFTPAAAGTGSHFIFYDYTDASGCSNQDSVSVPVEIVPKPTITINGFTMTCQQNGYNYQWYDGGLPITGATTQTYTATKNGTYSVRISLTNCFDDSDPLTITDFSQSELKIAYGFKLFPNPAQDEFQFTMENLGASDFHYEILSADGKILLQKQGAAGAKISETVSLKNMASGVYIFKIQIGDVWLHEPVRVLR